MHAREQHSNPFALIAGQTSGDHCDQLPPVVQWNGMSRHYPCKLSCVLSLTPWPGTASAYLPQADHDVADLTQKSDERMVSTMAHPDALSSCVPTAGHAAVHAAWLQYAPH